MQGGHQEPKIIQRIFPEPILYDDYNSSFVDSGITPCLTSKNCEKTPGYGWKVLEPLCIASRGRNVDNPSSRKVGEAVEQRLEVNRSGTTNTITSVQKDNYVMVPKIGQGFSIARDGDSVDFKANKSRTRGGHINKDVSHCLDTQCNIGVVFIDGFWWWVRKLTPRECLRLQDFPDSFKIVVSNAQAYKQAGNSMSVNVIEMLFRQIEKALGGDVPSGKLF